MEAKILTSQPLPQSRLAAEQYAYTVLERQDTGGAILDAIEADLRAGLTPSQIGSIWRRVSRFDGMPQLVEMAAEHVRRGMV